MQESITDFLGRPELVIWNHDFFVLALFVVVVVVALFFVSLSSIMFSFVS